MVKNVLFFILYLAIFIGMFCLLDFLWCTFITSSTYTFNPVIDLTCPILLAVISYVPIYRSKKK